MKLVIGLACGAALAAANQEVTAALYDVKPHAELAEKMQQEFDTVYAQFLQDFDVDAFQHQTANLAANAASFLKSRADYANVPGMPHCDAGASNPSSGLTVKSLAAFPGGPTKRVFGFDLSKMVDQMARKATGAAGASGVFPGILAMQAINAGAGMVKSAIDAAVQIVPPLIPPPIWINQPLPCLPMVSGHNCFGATPYLITAGDFMIADVADSQLDGVIAAFPSLYKEKVGKTSNTAYKACFAAYMSMNCASIFPRCNMPMSRDEPIPNGRVPMCFTHCIATLVACPGFWLNEVIDQCMMVSVPPMCTMSIFANMWLLPPQYTNYEESNPVPAECPTVPASLAAMDGATSFDLYTSEGNAIAASAYGSGKLPIA